VGVAHDDDGDTLRDVALVFSSGLWPLDEIDRSTWV
jgi:hypothetical protein